MSLNHLLISQIRTDCFNTNYKQHCRLHEPACCLETQTSLTCSIDSAFCLSVSFSASFCARLSAREVVFIARKSKVIHSSLYKRSNRQRRQKNKTILHRTGRFFFKWSQIGGITSKKICHSILTYKQFYCC